MAKEYIYTNTKSGKVIFRSIEANYVSKETVDQKVRDTTGHDPRIERHIIECTIRAVGEKPEPRSFGRFDKNKRMS